MENLTFVNYTSTTMNAGSLFVGTTAFTIVMRQKTNWSSIHASYIAEDLTAGGINSNNIVRFYYTRNNGSALTNIGNTFASNNNPSGVNLYLWGTVGLQNNYFNNVNFVFFPGETVTLVYQCYMGATAVNNISFQISTVINYYLD